MEIKIVRKWPKREYIIGQMYVDGVFHCDTLEPPLREMAPRMAHPAIPEGRYEVVMTWSPKFKEKRPLLLGVAGRDAIRIHEGNHVSNTLGCILVGRNKCVGYLSDSKKALKPLMQKITTARLKGEVVWIDIRDK